MYTEEANANDSDQVAHSDRWYYVFDEYGFRHVRSRQRHGLPEVALTELAIQQKQSEHDLTLWQKIVFEDGGVQKCCQNRWPSIRRLVLRGIPVSIRGVVWQQVLQVEQIIQAYVSV
jgi:hypothetical protein